MNHNEDKSSWDPRRLARQLGVLGERVRAARQSHAWSQQDLGNRTEIHRANISRIESGKKNFTLEVLWRLANTLQVHWADLLDDNTTDVHETLRGSTQLKQQLTAFGTRVYQARVLQRLSQQGLADRTGIGPSTIYWIEDGTRNVTLETLSRLAAGLRVHWADLLDDRQATPRDRPHEDDPIPGPANQTRREREPRLIDAAKELAAAFDRHDRPRLAELSTVELDRHLYARRLLSDYLNQMLRDSQRRGLDSAVQSEWSSVAALRDLAQHLLATARNEQARRD